MSRRSGPCASEELVAHLGHELRAPLAIVVGYAELLQRRDDPELREEATQRIHQAAERLGAAIDDLLVVFAAETGALTFEPVRLALDAHVDEAVEVIRARNGVRCTFDVERDEAGLVEVRADEEHLKKIVIDLLANAARRAPEESVVAVGLRRVPPFGMFSVADAGPVVTDDDVGLGLYAVQCLVELHGGRLQAESSPAGAVFSATVPLAGR